MRGQSTSQAPKFNERLPTIKGALSAAGNSQGTATAIPLGQDCSVFTTVAASQGAILPSGVGFGEDYEVANHGASALSVYPPVGGQLGTLGVNAAYSVAAGKLAHFRCVGPNQFTTCP